MTWTLGWVNSTKNASVLTDLGDTAGFLTYAHEQLVLLNHEGLQHPAEQAGKPTAQNWFAAALSQQKKLKFLCCWKQPEKKLHWFSVKLTDDNEQYEYIVFNVF